MATFLLDLRYGWPRMAQRAGFTILLAALVGSPGLTASPRDSKPARSGEQFFLISSVDLAKHQIVLKAPTEVTELVRVSDKTVFVDEQGKPIHFKDLRAGDTIFATLASSGDGPRVLAHVRKGPMTVEELHRRYLASQ